MSNILQTIGQGIQKLGDADVQNRLQAFGATMRNDIQGAAALNSEYAARSQRNKELEAARKERLEQERTRKLERGEDRKWSVADVLAAQEFQATQAQAGRDFQASQQEDQQEHATNLYSIQRQHQVADRAYMSPLQKVELAIKAQSHIQEVDAANITREALGQKPLPYNTELIKLAGIDTMVQAIPQVESGGSHTNTDGSLVTSPAMLKKFGGDQSKALAADNAGLGTVQEAIMKYGDNWMDAMPDETKAYIQKNMGQLEQNPAPQTSPVQPSPSQLSPTGQPRNIKDLTPQQAAILSSRGLIADIDGNLVEKKGYSGEALDTYGRPIYLNEGKVLKPSEVKAMKDMETKQNDKKDKLSSDINTLNSSLAQLEDITQDDVENVGGFSAMTPGVSSLPGVKGSASKLQVVMAKEFLANITKMTGTGSLSNAEGSKLNGEFAGMIDDQGNLKMGISESVLKDKIYRTRALIEAVKASKENKVATGKDLSPDEVDALYKSNLKTLKAGPAAEKKTTGYTAEQQSLLDKY